MRRRRAWGAVAAIVVAVAAQSGLASPAQALDDTWTSVGVGTTANISGIAPAASGWVIVRDNKKALQNRVALLDDSAATTPLTWPGPPPTDLEAIDQVPLQVGTYAVLTSTGQGSLIQIQGSTLTLLRHFAVPNASSGVEAFALTVAGGQMVAVWATRGTTTAAAKVSTASFDTSTGAFGRAVTGKVRVPFPTVSVRQVSDLKVVGDRLVVSSTSDPGATGPFDSAVYDVGTVAVVAGQPALHLSAPIELGRYLGHKVEGIACSNGVGVLGSDDEKAGGSIRTDAYCGA
jgi:hypothetical protein